MNRLPVSFNERKFLMSKSIYKISPSQLEIREVRIKLKIHLNRMEYQ
jgi:hypothetical protein